MSFCDAYNKDEDYEIKELGEEEIIHKFGPFNSPFSFINLYWHERSIRWKIPVNFKNLKFINKN